MGRRATRAVSCALRGGRPRAAFRASFAETAFSLLLCQLSQITQRRFQGAQRRRGWSFPADGNIMGGAQWAARGVAATSRPWSSSPSPHENKYCCLLVSYMKAPSRTARRRSDPIFVGLFRAKRDIVIQVLYAAHGAQPYSRRQSGCRCVPDYLHLQLLGAIALLYRIG